MSRTQLLFKMAEFSPRTRSSYATKSRSLVKTRCGLTASQRCPCSASLCRAETPAPEAVTPEPPQNQRHLGVFGINPLAVGSPQHTDGSERWQKPTQLRCSGLAQGYQGTHPAWHPWAEAAQTLNPHGLPSWPFSVSPCPRRWHSAPGAAAQGWTQLNSPAGVGLFYFWAGCVPEPSWEHSTAAWMRLLSEQRGLGEGGIPPLGGNMDLFGVKMTATTAGVLLTPDIQKLWVRLWNCLPFAFFPDASVAFQNLSVL